MLKAHSAILHSVHSVTLCMSILNTGTQKSNGGHGLPQKWPLLLYEIFEGLDANFKKFKVQVKHAKWNFICI